MTTPLPTDAAPTTPSIRWSQIRLAPRQALGLLVDLSAFPAVGLAQLEQVLSSSEQQYYAAIVSAGDRQLRKTARAVLRLVLGQLTGVAPDRVCLELGTHGKPRLHGSSVVHFNVSHSAACALLAFALDAEIGCDIEQANRIEDIKALGEVVLHPEEAQTVLGLIGAAAQDAFMRCWVRKEAVLKAIGVGLSLDPTRINVGLSGPAHPCLGDERAVFNLHCLRPAAGYLAAIASPHPDCKWRTLRL